MREGGANSYSGSRRNINDSGRWRDRMAAMDGTSGPYGNAGVRSTSGGPRHLRDTSVAVEWERSYARVAIAVSACFVFVAILVTIIANVR